MVRPLGDVSGGTDVFREHCWRSSSHQRYAFGRLFRSLRDTTGKNAIARVNFHKDLHVWPNPAHISTLQASFVEVGDGDNRTPADAELNSRLLKEKINFELE